MDRKVFDVTPYMVRAYDIAYDMWCENGVKAGTIEANPMFYPISGCNIKTIYELSFSS